MKHTLLLLFTIVTLSTPAMAQSAGDYRSNGTGGGDWGDASTWETYDGASWVVATSAPSSADGLIDILEGDVVSVTTAVQTDQTTINGGGQLIVASGSYLTVEDGAGDDLTAYVDPFFFDPNGILTINLGGTLENFGVVNSSITNATMNGTYIHNQNGGALLEAGYQSGSTVIIRNVTNSAPSGLNKTFYNFEWDCPNQAATIILNSLQGINNDFILNDSNGRPLAMSTTDGSRSIGNDLEINNSGFFYVSPSSTYTLTIGGDLSINSDANLAMILTVNGNVTVDVGGDFTNNTMGTTSVNLVGGPGTANLNIEGDFSHLAGNISKSGSGPGAINFTGNTPQIVTIASGTALINGAIDFVVESGADVDLGESQIVGNSFTLENAGILRLGSTEANGALQNNTTFGNIIVPVANRSYATGSRIVYNASMTQYIGNGHPSGPALEVNNMNNVELITDATVSGNIILTSGSLIVDANTLTMGGNVTTSGGFIETTDQSSLVFNGNGAFGNFPFPAGAQQVNNVTVDRTGGSVTFDAPVTLVGDLILTNGSLRFSDLTLEGNTTRTSGNLYSLSGGVLTIQGSGAFGDDIVFATAGNTLDTFIFDRSAGTIVLGSSLNITNEFQLNNGSVDNSGTYLNFADGGTIIRQNGTLTGESPSVTSGTYNVRYTGTGLTTEKEIPPATDETSLGNLSIEGTVTLNQELYVNDGVALVNGSLTSGSNTIFVRGDWVKGAGSFVSGGSTVVFDATTVISGSNPTFGDVQITEDATVTFPSGSISITDFLQIDAGATFMHNNGTVLFNGLSDQSVGTGGAFLNNITVNKTGGAVNIQSTLNLVGRLRFLTASTLNSSGNLVLISTTDANGPGNGSIGNLEISDAATAEVTGNVTVQRYMSPEELGNEGGLYRYITPSVQNTTVANWQDDFPITGSFAGTSTGPGLTTNYSMFIYNESILGNLAAGYQGYPVSSNTEVLEVGRGYAAWVFGDTQVTLDLTGPIFSGDLQIPVTRTSSGDASADGWNLVGNPYPSSIDWDTPDGWDKSDVYGTVVVKDNGSNGIYRYWNGTDAGGGMRTALPSGRIATGQAFWVNAANDGIMWIGEAAKTATNAEFFREDAFTPNRLIIALDQGQKFDEALVVVSPDATNGYDPDLDIPKFANTHFNLSTLDNNGKKMAFNYVKTAGCEQQLAIDLSNASSGTYQLSFREVQSFEDGYQLRLMDTFTGQSYNLREQNSLTIQVDKNNPKTFGSSRFVLTIATDIATIVDADMPITASGAVCMGENASITIPASDNSISYQLKLNDELYGEILSGSESGTVFEVPEADMIDGENMISVVASASSCSSSLPLETQLTIIKAHIQPAITVNEHTLTSNYAEGNQWYFDDEPIEGATSQELMATKNGMYALEVTQNGCSARVSEQLIVTGNDDLFNGQIRIYPNPTDGVVNLSVNFADNNRETIINIYNSVGELMLQKAVSNSDYELDLSGWKSGMYMLQIVSDNEMQVHRLIKR